METELSWNQTSFPCSVSITFHSKMGEGLDLPSHIELRAHLVKAIKEASPWLYEGSQGNQKEDRLYITRKKKPVLEIDEKDEVTFDLEMVRVDRISPTQLRAFCAYVDSVAEQVVSSDINGLMNVKATVHFHPYSTHLPKDKE